MIIDAHTHPTPDRAQWPAFFDSMDFYGIDYAVTSSLHPDWPRFPSPAQLREANAFARDFAAESGGRVIWLAYLNPHDDGWRGELDTCLAEGARGVKLWLSVKDPKGENLDRCLPVLHAAGELGLPVLIHSCNRTDPEYAGEVNTAEVVHLARHAPRTTIIEGHAGSNWRRGLGLRAGIDNLYADFCAYFPEKDKVARILADTGADRVLFGSDFFIRDLAGQLAKVVFSDLDPEDREKILWKNAARVFGFPATPRLARSDAARRPEPVLADPTALPDATVDHFAFCGRGPFFPSPRTAAELDRDFARWEIKTAHVVSADGLYCDDLIAANDLFADQVAGFPRIVALATLDPAAPAWTEHLRRARERFQGGFVSPYLHNYRLDDPAHAAFFRACADARFPLWINCAVGDYRWRHRGVCPRPVKTDELVAFLDTAPENRYVVQGATRGDFEAVFMRNPERPGVLFEVSRFVDFPGNLAAVVEKFGIRNLAFGSEYPLREPFANRWMADRAIQFARRAKN